MSMIFKAVILLLAAFMSGYSFDSFHETKERRLAGIHQAENAMRLMKKSYPVPADLKLESNLAPPAKPQEPFVVTAIIMATDDIQGVLEWKFRKGMRILSGRTSANISLRAGETVQEAVTLEVDDINNHHIFVIFKYKDSRNQTLSLVEQFVTNPQALDPIHNTPLRGKVLFAKPRIKSELNENLDSEGSLEIEEEEEILDTPYPPRIMQ